jgi:hypothetical protein
MKNGTLVVRRTAEGSDELEALLSPGENGAPFQVFHLGDCRSDLTRRAIAQLGVPHQFSGSEMISFDAGHVRRQLSA